MTRLSALALVLATAVPAAAQPAQPPTTARPATPATAAPPAPAQVASVATPPDYVIGAEDVLSIIVWREKDLSVDVMVRPDGKVSVPLLNDIQAAGLTPEQFRESVTTEAAKYVETPSVTIIVKQINSRRVYVMGEVNKTGPYPLTAPTTVLQLLAMAGGPTDFADSKNITVVRTERGKAVSYKFNYKDVSRGRRVEQNILLKPGDTVIVP